MIKERRIENVEVLGIEMPYLVPIRPKVNTYRATLTKIKVGNLVGWGEFLIFGERFWPVHPDLHRYLKESLMGRDLFSMFEVIYDSRIDFGVGLEIAYLDLIGKIVGTPWSNIYGRKKDSSPVVYTYAPGIPATQDFHNFDYIMFVSSGSWDKDEEVLQTLEITTGIYWPTPDTMELADEFGLLVLSENPIARYTDIPLLNKYNYLTFLSQRAFWDYDYVMIDVSTFGVTKSMRIADILESYGIVPILFPGFSSSLLNSVAFHIALLYADALLVLTSHLIHEDIGSPSFTVEEGEAYDIGRPGNGCWINHGIVSKYAVNLSTQ
ncbi:MAG: hypothetical protein DRN30_06020 [Thermoplasmata archaeon]|nr:hypothetical protein [Euryarchaeota archaeon]RLF63912.1 MAG: hypothetical protein DRN30_06020 [Thermoplasmata archaeon]